MFGRAEELGFVLNETMFYNAETNMVTLPDGLEFDLAVLNYAKYIKEVRLNLRDRRTRLTIFIQNYVTLCPIDAGATVEQVRTILWSCPIDHGLIYFLVFRYL